MQKPPRNHTMNKKNHVCLSAFFKDRFTTFTLSFTARIKPKSVTAFDLPTFCQTDLIQSTSDPG